MNSNAIQYNLVILRNGLVEENYWLQSESDLENAFKREVEAYGVEPTDIDYDNGYVQLGCGVTICMTTTQRYTFEEKYFWLVNDEGLVWNNDQGWVTPNDPQHPPYIVNEQQLPYVDAPMRDATEWKQMHSIELDNL